MVYVKNFGLVLVALICVSLTLFHHGWANYNQNKVLDFETVIEQSTYENPHAMARVKYEKATWDVYLAPATRMTARGVSAEMIRKGTKLRIVAYPHKTVKKRNESGEDIH